VIQTRGDRFPAAETPAQKPMMMMMMMLMMTMMMIMIRTMMMITTDLWLEHLEVALEHGVGQVGQRALQPQGRVLLELVQGVFRLVPTALLLELHRQRRLPWGGTGHIYGAHRGQSPLG
jgi:hypothetical protein